MTDLVGNQAEVAMTGQVAERGTGRVDGPLPFARGYSIAVDLRGRSCLVVGGGAVAARKMAGLTAAGAVVTVVAPVVVDAIRDAADAGEVALALREYRAGEAAAHRLVITATGVPDVDAVVAADADAAGVWVNSADDPANCTFILPAVHRVGPLTVSVSSGGASPALASWVRTRIAGVLDDLLGEDPDEIIGLLAEARTRVKASGRSTESVDWRALLEGPFPGLVRDGQLTEARARLDTAIG